MKYEFDIVHHSNVLTLADVLNQISSVKGAEVFSVQHVQNAPFCRASSSWVIIIKKEVP